MAKQYFRFPASAPEQPRRSELLEKLAARADVVRRTSDWRADAFHVIAPDAAVVPAVACAALLADCGPVEGAWVCVATPVNYVAEMSGVRLSQDGILALTAPIAETLTADFNRIWNGSGVRLMAGAWAPRAAAQLYCIFDKILHVTTRDPQDVLGRNIEEYLPSGTDAPRLRQLMSEIEMWLFEQASRRADLPRLNAFWLWGGGMPLESLPRVSGWFAGDDLFFSALTRGSSGNEKSDSGVVVTSKIPGSDAWNEIESHWLKPAAAQLRSRRISRLDLSGGERCITLNARLLPRFWRRREPWWESFA
ncbi:MAG: hypothetical protein M3O26_03995 [Pseudomonadota bacterium]|nr:hypothetical protein [Pseudomonadota bacterium]